MILFLKDIEKSLVGNSDVYATLKSKLENLPENIVVIASQTQLDARKEKVGILSNRIWFSFGIFKPSKMSSSV